MIIKRTVAFLLVTLLAVSSFAVNPRDMKFSELTFEPTDPVRFVADNGMVVYFLEYHELPIVSLSAYFHGGSIYDPSGKSGLTDITATLLRSGGAGERTPEQVDQDLDFVGARIGAGANADYLSVSLSSLKKDKDLGFEILSDMLVNPGFDSAKMALELSNMKDEIRRQNDGSWGISRRVFNQALYGDHPYGQFATLASVDNISRDDIIDHHKQFYAPDNCIMAITGDMTVSEARALVEKYFGSWKKSGNEVAPIKPAHKQYKAGVYYAEKDISQANIRFGHLGLGDDDPDRFAMEVMNFVLGGSGFTSRITREVRTRAGLAYSVGSYQTARPYTGMFFGYCLTRADAMAQATEMMLELISEVKANGITAEEMELAKESIINSYVFEYDTPGELVAAKAYLELRGFDKDQLKTNIEAYKAVTLDDCNRIARDFLDTEDIVIVVTGNKEMFDKPLETFGPVTAVDMEIK